MKKKTKHTKRAAPRRATKKAHKKKKRRNPAAQLSMFPTTRKAHAVTKKKAKRPRALYKAAKRGGHKRRTSAVKGTVYKRSKRGKVRRVRRVNPGFSGILGALGAVAAGFAAGVAVRVGTHLAAPGSANAPKIAGALGMAAGVLMASRMSNPLIGIGIAVGAADAAFQNDVTFKAEMIAAPKPAGISAIAYQNMRGMELARSQPSYTKIGALPQFMKMGAIVSNDMRGFADGRMGGMRVRNPFDH